MSTTYEHPRARRNESSGEDSTSLTLVSAVSEHLGEEDFRERMTARLSDVRPVLRRDLPRATVRVGRRTGADL